MLKYFKYILSAIFSFISEEYSQDSRWVYVGTSDEANYYYDSNAVTHNGNTGEIFIKFVYINSFEWDYCIARYKVYIEEKNLTAETSLYFDKNGKPTEILSCEKESIIPETPEEAIFNVFMEKTSS